MAVTLATALTFLLKGKAAKNIKEGFVNLSLTAAKNGIEKTADKLELLGTLKQPFAAAIGQIQQDLVTGTAEQSAQTTTDMINLIQSDSVQQSIRNISEIANSILRLIEIIADDLNLLLNDWDAFWADVRKKLFG